MKHQLKQSYPAAELLNEVGDVKAEIQTLLDEYVDQLLWWNERVNLVSREVSRETIHHHLYHSLLLYPFLRAGIPGSSTVGNSRSGSAADSPAADKHRSALKELVVDAGSGGGLPGFILSLALPDSTFILNDIQMKKCLAVEQMAKTMKRSNISVWCGDIGGFEVSQRGEKSINVSGVVDRSDFIVVSKHAFKLADLLNKLEGKPWKKLLMLKGLDDIQRETESLKIPSAVEEKSVKKERSEERASSLDESRPSLTGVVNTHFVDLQDWTKEDIFSGKGILILNRDGS